MKDQSSNSFDSSLWQCDICRSIYRFSMKVTLAADLAADLSSEGGEVTAKLNTDQWVVVRQVPPQFSHHSTYIKSGSCFGGANCHCSAQPEEPKSHGGDEIFFAVNIWSVSHALAGDRGGDSTRQVKLWFCVPFIIGRLLPSN